MRKPVALKFRGCLFVGCVAACLVGCVSTPKLESDYEPQEYVLVADPLSNLPQPAFVILGDLLINSKEVPIDSIRAREVNIAVNEFVNLIADSGLFGSVDRINSDISYESGYLIEVNFVEKENTHKLGAAAKGFLSGFFTLGVAPISTNYTYSSDLITQVTKPDGSQIEIHSMRSASVSSTDTIGLGNGKGGLARTFVTDENMKSIVAQLIDSTVTLDAEDYASEQ